MSGGNEHLLSTLATIKSHEASSGESCSDCRRLLWVAGQVAQTRLLPGASINNNNTEKMANVAQIGSLKL